MTEINASMTDDQAKNLGRAMPLIAQIMEQNARDLNSTTNSLLDKYKAERDEARATLAAIRREIDWLLNQPCQPSSLALARAMYPSRESIDEHRAELEI